eukprot:gene14576-595_t
MMDTAASSELAPALQTDATLDSVGAGKMAPDPVPEGLPTEPSIPAELESDTAQSKNPNQAASESVTAKTRKRKKVWMPPRATPTPDDAA